MARPNRGDLIDPREVQIVHAISRSTRACWLFGDDPHSGKNYDHRKEWIVGLIKRFAANFGIDVLSYSVLSNHHHQMLRSRPDVVETWSDTEVARRWLMICPVRKDPDGNPANPSKSELDGIRNRPKRLEEIRLRLSDVSWWMRLLNQRVAQRANKEDEAKGRFFEDRFDARPLIDEESVLACSVYVDLNWIRACMAETIELSDFTSAQQRVKSVQEAIPQSSDDPVVLRPQRSDAFLAPVDLRESTSKPGPMPSRGVCRCSDKGFLAMNCGEYLELLDWSARQAARGKKGKTPDGLPPILRRLGIDAPVWIELMRNFEDLFTTIAGIPENIDRQRGKQTGRRFHVPRHTRELFAQAT